MGMSHGGAKHLPENHAEAVLAKTWLCSWDLGSNPGGTLTDHLTTLNLGFHNCKTKINDTSLTGL